MNEFRHWTETARPVWEYLRKVFQTKEIQVNEFGADLTVGGKNVEVKSCREWIKDAGANGKRRRGRFHFQHENDAQYIVFVLIREDGTLVFKTVSGYQYKLKKGTKALPWPDVFAPGLGL